MSAVTLVEAQARTASSDSGPLTGFAAVEELTLQLTVTAASGTTPTLDVYLQTSYDGGATWQDVVAFPRLSAPGRRVASTREAVATAGNVASATVAATDQALAADTVVPIPLGDLIRCAWVIGGT